MSSDKNRGTLGDLLKRQIQEKYGVNPAEFFERSISLWDWLRVGMSTLPRSADPLIREIWANGKLVYEDCPDVDSLDEITARLSCAAIAKRQSLLVLLPDSTNVRTPLSFATVLLTHAFDCMELKKPGKCVLYFGTEAGIRHQLGRISVGDLRLSSVFPQTWLQRSGKHASERVSRKRCSFAELSTYLPRVVCIYSPAAVEDLFRHYQPDWIAVDLNGDAHPAWLEGVLREAQKRKKPVIAWSSNPLSDAVAMFRSFGLGIFRWASPPVSTGQRIAGKLSELDKGFLTRRFTTEITPCVLIGAVCEKLSKLWAESADVLIRAGGKKDSELCRGALQVAWRYLRALQNLAIPIDFYEAQVASFQYWSLPSLKGLAGALERFADACEQPYPALAKALRRVQVNLEASRKLLGTHPPRWLALVSLIDEAFAKQKRLTIVFPTLDQKRIFAHAMLAERNRSEYELEKSGVSLTHFREFSDPETAEDVLIAVFPSIHATPLITPLLNRQRVSFLLYSAEHWLLKGRLEKWADGLAMGLGESAEALAKVIDQKPPIKHPDPQAPIKVEDATPLNVTASEKTPAAKLRLWSANKSEDEVAYLLAAEPAGDESLPTPNETAQGATERAETLLSNAIEIEFLEGWKALFAPDATLNVIMPESSSERLCQYLVRSLTKGTRVLFIPEQNRQSLFDLLISRVHSHPSMRLHISIIRKWRDELAWHFAKAKESSGMTPEKLLSAIQAKGSRRLERLTVQKWLDGQVYAPKDPKDLLRLGEVLGSKFLVDYYEQIERAARRIWGLHIGFGLRIEGWLKEGAKVLTEGRDEVIDEELGLTLLDFKHSFLPLTVRSVTSREGIFLQDMLGKLEKP